MDFLPSFVDRNADPSYLRRLIILNLPELVWLKVFKYLDVFDFRHLRLALSVRFKDEKSVDYDEREWLEKYGNLGKVLEGRDRIYFKTYLIHNLERMGDPTYKSRLRCEGIRESQGTRISLLTDAFNITFDLENKVLESRIPVEHDVSDMMMFLDQDDPDGYDGNPTHVFIDNETAESRITNYFLHRNFVYAKYDKLIIKRSLDEQRRLRMDLDPYGERFSELWKIIYTWDDVHFDIDLVHKNYLFIQYYGDGTSAPGAIDRRFASIFKLPNLEYISMMETDLFPGFRYSVSSLNHEFPKISLSDWPHLLRGNILKGTLMKIDTDKNIEKKEPSDKLNIKEDLRKNIEGFLKFDMLLYRLQPAKTPNFILSFVPCIKNESLSYASTFENVYVLYVKSKFMITYDSNEREIHLLEFSNILA